MRYDHFSTEDFIQDEYFQQWVDTPDANHDKFWNTFIQNFPHKQESIDEAREFLLLLKTESAVPFADIENIKKQLNERIDIEEQQVRPLLSRRTIQYGIAASLLIAVSFLGYFAISDSKSILPRTFSDRQQHSARGERRYIELEDGSKVWLNSDSRLTYSNDFAKEKTREVFLEGEAFFDVAENKDKPFIVNTDGVSIKVLGTAFNVKSYAEDSFIETTLVRGKITLTPKQEINVTDPLTLVPNEQAVFIKDSKEILLQNNVTSEDFTDWKNGWIVFDDKSFSYIKETLERWYNVKIDVEDESSLSCTFTGRFKDKPLKEVLEIFSSNDSSVSYRTDGDHVYITGKLCE